MEKNNEPDTTENILRFIVALILGLLITVAAGVLMFILCPIIMGGSMIILTVAAVLSVLIGILGFLTVLWYLAREEPPLNGNDFSMEQGEEIK